MTVVEQIFTTRDLVRTRGGDVIHRADCTHLKQAKKVHPWYWPMGYTESQIRREAPWLHFCKTCFPAANQSPKKEGEGE